MARYRIVAGSRIETDMTSNVHPIHAAAERVSGVIEGVIEAGGGPDFEAPHNARVEIPVESMQSGNRLQDMEMQRRIDARQFPTIVITVNRAWKVAGDGRTRARFEVEAHGRARPYEGDFSLRVDGRRLTVEGEHTFDMRDFGVDPPRFLGLKMDPEVNVKVRLEAVEDSPA